MEDALKPLLDALTVSSYKPNNLEFGSALQVEDLNLTMQVRTFVSPRWGTRSEIVKIIKQLIRRNLSYTLKERNDVFNRREISLIVGERLLIYIV